MKPDPPSIKDRVLHIIEAIEHITAFSHDYRNYADFSKDKLVISACLYQFTIISEAANYVPSEMLAKYPYPWNKIKGFRNFVLHHYDGVDTQLVWDTIHVVLPPFKEIVQQILENEF